MAAKQHLPAALGLTVLVLMRPLAAGAEEILTLRGAIEAAIRANHGLRLAHERILAAQSKVQESTAQALPQITLSGNFNQQNPVGPLRPTAPGLDPQFAAFLGTARVNNLQTTLQASQVVFAGFRVIDGIRLATMSVAQSEMAWRQTKADVALQTVQAYFNALRTQGALELATQAVDQARAHLAQARAFLKAGTGVKVDVLRAETQSYQAQQGLSQAVNNRRKAQQALNMMLGAPIDAPLALNPAAEVGEIRLDEATAATQGLAGRPEMQQLQAKKVMDELTASIQSRGTWPTVSLVGQYNIRDTAVVQANSTNQQNATVGLNLNWPLFDGLGVAAKTEQAKQAVSQDLIQLDQIRQQIRMEVAQAFLDVREATERRLLAEQSLKTAEEALRLARLRYQAGVGTGLEVLDAQVGWQQARISHINAAFDVNLSRAKAYRAVGYDVTPEKDTSSAGARPAANVGVTPR